MTDDERWYIVDALDDLRWAEAFAANGLRWREITCETILPYTCREVVEAAWLRRESPREGDRIVDGADFDAIRMMIRAHRAVE